MKILFIGCVESSYRLLEKLVERNKEVVGVVTKEKSGFHADFYDLRPFCENHGIPCCYVKDINGVDSMDFMINLKPDIGFCFGWSQLLREEVINLFPQGVVGFHPAKLPHNRGRHPLIWALALGLEETASTFFMLNSGADEGDIISQKKVRITYEDDARTLYDKVMSIAVQQEADFLESIENGTAQRIRQPASGGNTWRKRSRIDGEIDWRMSSRGIYNLVRSLSKPYVGAHFMYGGKEYKVWKVQEIDTVGMENFEPGKVLAVGNNGAIDVKTGQGGIRLIDFEPVEIKEGDYIL